MSGKGFFSLIGLTLLLLVLNSSLYIIKETERAVKLQFGELVESDLQPGLHAKFPMVHQIRRFDARVMTLDARPERYLTIEKKPLIVDSYAKWRVADAGTYYTATNGEEARVNRLLSQRVNTGLRNKVGERTQHEVVSGERDELMGQLTTQLNAITLQELGVEVIDIRVKKIDLPDEVSGSVYNRMRTEREREAREHRSKGKELAEGIRADADRQRTILEAEAYRDAELIRGEGDAKASSVYADAYTKDPEFYSFWRSLLAYKETFQGREDIMLLSPDSDFFRYLRDSSGTDKAVN